MRWPRVAGSSLRQPGRRGPWSRTGGDVSECSTSVVVNVPPESRRSPVIEVDADTTPEVKSKRFAATPNTTNDALTRGSGLLRGIGVGASAHVN